MVTLVSETESRVQLKSLAPGELPIEGKFLLRHAVVTAGLPRRRHHVRAENHNGLLIGTALAFYLKLSCAPSLQKKLLAATELGDRG